MRVKTFVIAMLLITAVGGSAALLAEEKIEHVIAPETGELRPPEGEWVRSVRGQTAEVWAVGDADPPRAAGVARLIRRADADRILYLGDVYPDGNRDDFTRWAEPWGRLVRRMAPTPGNHDWPEAREGYEPFWRKVTGQTPPTYYSFNAGGWEVLSVNSEHSEWRSAENWLIDKVSSGGNCRIAFWHRPRYTAGKYADRPVPESAEHYWEAVEGRTRIVVNGHDHNLQRMRARNGTVGFIAGAGGRKLHPVDESARRLAFSSGRYGALRLDLSPGRAHWRFVAVGGDVLDEGSLRCRA